MNSKKWAARVWAALRGRDAPASYYQPGPNEIALALGAGLAASGGYRENPGVVWGIAWASVPNFYLARDNYVKRIAPVIFATPAAAAAQSPASAAAGGAGGVQSGPVGGETGAPV